MKIRNFLIATVALGGLSVTACSKSPIDKIESIKDEVCACKDAACTEKVMKDNEHLKDEIDPSKFSEGDKKRFEEITMEMMGCVMKLQGAEVPAGE